MENRNFIEKSDYPNICNKTTVTNLKNENIEIFSSFRHENPVFIDPSDFLCNAEEDVCLDVKKEVGPLFNGAGHLSYFGAEIIADGISASLMDID